MESKTVFDNYDLKTAIAGRGISAFTDGLDGNAVLNRAILIFLTAVVAVFAAVLIVVNKNYFGAQLSRLTGSYQQTAARVVYVKTYGSGTSYLELVTPDNQKLIIDEYPEAFREGDLVTAGYDLTRPEFCFIPGYVSFFNLFREPYLFVFVLGGIFLLILTNQFVNYRRLSRLVMEGIYAEVEGTGRFETRKSRGKQQKTFYARIYQMEVNGYGIITFRGPWSLRKPDDSAANTGRCFRIYMADIGNPANHRYYIVSVPENESPGS